MPFAAAGALSLLVGGAAAKAGKKKKKRSTTQGFFNTPGFTGTFTGDKKNRTFNLTRTSETSGLLTDLRSRLGDTTSALRDLRSQVAPGFGDLTQARVKAIRDAGARTVGNLRQELGKRRVAGSSFAEREISATEATFAREEERARAEAKVQEIALTDQLIAQEFDVGFQVLTALINQGNFEASLAADIQIGAENLRESRRTTNAQISQANSAGLMEAAGTAIAAYFAFSSDRRLKTNIQRIGTVNGYPWYSFIYLWGEKSEGVMSDEVPARYVTQVDGYDMVNYFGVINATV